MKDLKVGDTVRRTSPWGWYGTGYTFVIGRIHLGGSIVVEKGRDCKHSASSLQKVTPTNNKKNKRMKSTDKWSFKADGMSEIDMASIKADLTRKNPVALIQGAEHPAFIVSDQLEAKLQCCINSWALKDRLVECSKRYIVPISGVVIHVVEFNENIKKFLSIWSEVRKSSLLKVCKFSKQRTITVSLPKI